MPRQLVHLACVLLAILVSTGCERRPTGSGGLTAEVPAPPSAEFLSLMNAGKNHLEQGDATNALVIYRKAAALVPQDADVHLNLANAHLLAGDLEASLREADEVLARAPNSAAAYFVKGSAHLRAARFEAAVQALENVRAIEPGDTATSFQLGRARMGLEQWDAAIAAFREGLAMDPNRLHAAAHYLLAQSLLRAGRHDEAQQEIQQHQISLDAGGNPGGIGVFERSKFTQARVPFLLDQPESVGIPVRFVDVTRETLGEASARYAGPVGVIDVQRTGWNSLFVREPGRGFRLLTNTEGAFVPDPAEFPAHPGATYGAVLVGDLQNDRFDDVVVLGEPGSHLFRFGTNGQASDVSEASGLRDLRARDGALVDLDFTGKLDLLVVGDAPREVRLLRQFGPLHFLDRTATSGIPASLRNARSVAIEDWNRDGNADVIVGRASESPQLLEKRRGGHLVPREAMSWAEGSPLCTGDFDNDLRPDLAVVGAGTLTLCFQGGGRREIALPDASGVRQLVAVDYDNDGWLDLWVVGEKVRAWRNRGLAGFEEQTAALGLDALEGGAVASVHFADFDRDCDSDAIVALAGGGLRHWRNEGANAHSQVKVQLVGNRSNASGLGCRIEIETGGLRLFRTVQRLPVEIGVGRHATLDSLLVHWFNWPQGSADVRVDCPEPFLAVEAILQEGSCPYLYAWDGRGFRFVTDILGAAPLGLPVSEGRWIEADPEEWVWIGDEAAFPPRDGKFEVRITEELREALYLDEAKLVVVDHPAGVEVHPTDKLLPGGPFPRGTVWGLDREQPLREALTLEGRDETEALRSVDGHRASPPRVRAPQLRGLAESHGWILDFGPLDVRRPWVLVLNGWLRFGGGMANIAASHDPALPFPFPALEAENPAGMWEPVEVVVGAPAGKTKTILVDLAGRLKPGTRRLRLTGAFEIHWDRIALLEKRDASELQITSVSPEVADLRYRGFGAVTTLPPDAPITPHYDAVDPNSVWTVVPGGWATRYGDVLPLIAERDEALAVVASGDELSLAFPAGAVPPKAEGRARSFFLYVDGWDKDSDFHVLTGTQIEPLPFHGQDDQRYGREARPPFPSDALHRKYNTRWVEGRALKQAARR